MAINYRFLCDNLRALLPDYIEFSDIDQIIETFNAKDATRIAEYTNLVARDVRARCSTLNFPQNEHEYGDYKPSRHLGMATRYLEEIGRAIQSGKSDYTTDELGWHAFGAVVQALAGILQHIENEKEQT